MRSGGGLDEGTALTKRVRTHGDIQAKLIDSAKLRREETQSTKQTLAKVRHILRWDSSRVHEHGGIDAHKLNNQCCHFYRQ